MERLIGKKVSDRRCGDCIIKDVRDGDSDVFITITVENPFVNHTTQIALLNSIDLGYLSSDDEELWTIVDEIRKRKKDECLKAIEKQKAEAEARRKAQEEAAKNKEKQLKESSDLMLKNAKVKIEETNRNQEFAPLDPHRCTIYKVHQNKTFKEEFAGGYVWAPADEPLHHQILKDIRPGDIIFHYAKGGLVAVGEAVSECFDYPCPEELKDNGWGNKGYRVEVRYQKLEKPYSLAAHVDDILKKKNDKNSSFNIKGGACEGYMYELEYALAKLFKSGILSQHQPAGVKRVLDRI